MINYTLVISNREEVICVASMVKAVEFSDASQLEAFQWICCQIGIEYGDFEYNYELYAAK